MATIRNAKAPFGDLLRQVVDLKTSLDEPAAPDPAVGGRRLGRAGADPFSCGGVAGLAAAAAVAAGGSVGVDDWLLEVAAPPAARRRRLGRAGNFEGFEFDGGRLTQTDRRGVASNIDFLEGGVNNV